MSYVLRFCIRGSPVNINDYANSVHGLISTYYPRGPTMEKYLGLEQAVGKFSCNGTVQSKPQLNHMT